MPRKVETGGRPEWTYKRRARPVWVEDDATCSQCDHEGLRTAWRRLFKTEMPEAVETWNGGDAVYLRMPGDLVVIESYPGNSEIRKLSGPPVGGVCCSCGFSGDEETDCPARDDAIHCEHWWDGPAGDDPEHSG